MFLLSRRRRAVHTGVCESLSRTNVLARPGIPRGRASAYPDVRALTAMAMLRVLLPVTQAIRLRLPEAFLRVDTRGCRRSLQFCHVHPLRLKHFGILTQHPAVMNLLAITPEKRCARIL